MKTSECSSSLIKRKVRLLLLQRITISFYVFMKTGALLSIKKSETFGFLRRFRLFGQFQLLCHYWHWPSIWSRIHQILCWTLWVRYYNIKWNNDTCIFCFIYLGFLRSRSFTNYRVETAWPVSAWNMLPLINESDKVSSKKALNVTCRMKTRKVNERPGVKMDRETNTSLPSFKSSSAT